MSETLDKMLHGPSALPILVKSDGTYETAAYPPARLEDFAPESIEVAYDGPLEEAQISDDQERDMVKTVKRDTGWDVLTGWALGGGVAIMHNSQYIGGDLEEHIKETPGLWAIASIEMHPRHCEAGDDGMPCADYTAREKCEHADGARESEAAGWALIHKEIAEDGA